MKQKEVFKKIGGILQELSDQYDYLETVPDDLNDLELELFASNAHFLTDHIEILCKLNLQNAKLRKVVAEAPAPPAEKPKPEPQREEKYFEPVVQQVKPGTGKDTKPAKALLAPAEAEAVNHTPQIDDPVPEINIADAIPADSYSYEREEPEIIKHELIIDEADLDDDELVAVETEVEPEPAKSSSRKKKADAVVAEEEAIPAVEEAAEPVTEEAVPVVNEVAAPEPGKEDADEVLTINQKILSQMGDKAASKADLLTIKPIGDIKLAITLNDKLLYVKDLFNGYNLAYSEAIEILNRFSTFDEAMRFLRTNYITKNNWEGKPATTEKFYALLKRRYA